MIPSVDTSYINQIYIATDHVGDFQSIDKKTGVCGSDLLELDSLADVFIVFQGGVHYKTYRELCKICKKYPYQYMRPNPYRINSSLIYKHFHLVAGLEDKIHCQYHIALTFVAALQDRVIEWPLLNHFLQERILGVLYLQYLLYCAIFAIYIFITADGC